MWNILCTQCFHRENVFELSSKSFVFRVVAQWEETGHWGRDLEGHTLALIPPLLSNCLLPLSKQFPPSCHSAMLFLHAVKPADYELNPLKL